METAVLEQDPAVTRQLFTLQFSGSDMEMMLDFVEQMLPSALDGCFPRMEQHVLQAQITDINGLNGQCAELSDIYNKHKEKKVRKFRNEGIQLGSEWADAGSGSSSGSGSDYGPVPLWLAAYVVWLILPPQPLRCAAAAAAGWPGEALCAPPLCRLAQPARYHAAAPTARLCE